MLEFYFTEKFHYWNKGEKTTTQFRIERQWKNY